MRLLKVSLPLAVAIVIALSVFAAPVSAASPASTPTWQQGQSVGYGTSLDLGALANTYLALITSNPSAFNITNIQALNVTGSLDTWQVDTVSQVTSTYYVLSSQGAEGLKLHVEANLTLNNLPQAGTYTGTVLSGYCIPALPPTGSGTVAATLDATVLSETSGASHLQISNLAYLSQVANETLQANVVFTGYHLPSTSTNTTSCTTTVSYDSPTFTLTADTKTQVRMLFDPAWDYFNFPISDNKTWWANATATVGATLSGTVNVQGLSSADEQAFFDNVTKSFASSGLTVTGLDGFPIDLAKISVLAGPSYIVNNGVVTDYPLPIASNERAIASAETLSDGNQHPTYLITDASYTCPSSGSLLGLPVGYAAVYAPDFPAPGAGMVVGYQLLVCTGTASLAAFELKNTSPADAQAKIGQTETKYQVVPPSQGNVLADFFLQSPYWGVILIAAVVLVAGALLAMRRRRRRSAAPPPPPPAGPGTP